MTTAGRDLPSSSTSAAVGVGAIAGLLLTAPLLGLWYLASTLAPLPFVPFDLFDGLTRVLPGAAVTLGIDLLVGLIQLLHIGSTASAAKTAEQSMAVTLWLLVGVVAGVIVFGTARRARTVRSPALVCGAALAIAGWSATVALHRGTDMHPLVSAAWIGGTMIAWSLALAWMHACLQQQPSADSPTAMPIERTVDRRRFLIRMGGAMAATTIATTTVGARVRSRRDSGPISGPIRRWSSQNALPNADDPLAPVSGTRPELTNIDDHYRIDINTMPPVIHEADWRLAVGGLVDRPVQWSLDDLRAHAPLHQLVTLSCISNPVGGDLIGTTRWTGVSLRRLISEWAVKPGATHLRIRSADGFYEVVPLDLIRRDERVMLTYAWDGVPLPVEHGFPLRIYIPNVYGMKQPKWIQSIDAIDRWEPGYWVERGWDREATMKATSVIDVARAGERGADGRLLVTAGGIAHAGVRGISRVEVRVDDGAWQEVKLRAPLSAMTWRLWHAELPLEMNAGHRVLTVRCYESDGTPQLTTVAPPHPSGASGLHGRDITQSRA